MNSSEKIYPTSKKPPIIPTTSKGPTTKPATMPTATTTAAKPNFPPVKAKLPPADPRYRPRPPSALRGNPHDRHRHHRRQCCTCRCCFYAIVWAVLIIIALLVLSAITSAVLYGVYHPQPPSFSLSSVEINQFNISSLAQFNKNIKFNLNITTENPSSSEVTFYYNPISLTLITQKGEIEIGQGSFPAYFHHGKTQIKQSSTITNKTPIDETSFEQIQNQLKKTGSINLEVKIETKVKVEIGKKVKSNHFGVRASCGSIKIQRAKNGKFTTEIGSKNCKVDLFIILYDWEIPI